MRKYLDANKVISVVMSCKNHKQYLIARRMVINYKKTYPYRELHGYIETACNLKLELMRSGRDE